MRYKVWLEGLEGADRVLYVMRGVPGSGKSTEALRLAGGDESKVFSVDDYFGVGGEYEVPESIIGLRAARRWNYARVLDAVSKGVTPVVADETHLKASLARPYFDIASRHGYRTEIREPNSEWWREIEPLLKDKVGNDAALRRWSDALGGRTCTASSPRASTRCFGTTSLTPSKIYDETCPV